MRLRSLLFAPAVKPDLLRKLPRTGADAVAIDCEDATPPSAKEQGRSNAKAIGAELVDDGRAAVFVRINGFGTPWLSDDLAGALPEGLAGVIVPKVERLDELDQVAGALDAMGHDRLGVLAGLESALGVAESRALLAHDRVIAGYFGAEDFVADMGGLRTESNNEVLYARSQVALAGRLAEVPILDQVVVAFRDEARFAREAAQARAMGFAGKLCIHPSQVSIANVTFSPSEEEVARARAIVDAYAEAGEAGIGVIVVDGQMIDEALVAQARKVLGATS